MATATVLWHPADVFAIHPTEHKDFAVVILNQPLHLTTSFYERVWANAVYHIAADGGANHLLDSLVRPDVEGSSFRLDAVIGDLDSLRPEVGDYWSQKGAEIIRDPDQYATDFTKAVNHIRSLETRSRDIVSIGGLGGRVDQGLSQLHHLFMFQKDYNSGKMLLLSTEAISFVLQPGKHKIKVMEKCEGWALGKNIGIIPLQEPAVITTTGLEWDVTDWPTEFGGQVSTSNYVREEWVTVQTSHSVLFTIDFGP